MRIYYFIFLAAIITLQACKSQEAKFDASGSFEADEVIVSSELNGQLLTFPINEGDSLSKGQVAGTIDATNVTLQKEQVQASIGALSEKTVDAGPQVALLRDQLKVEQSQLDKLVFERERTERLVKAEAATQKQLDDINAQIDVQRRQMLVTNQQIAVQKNNINTQNRSILSERQPLQKQAAQLEEQLSKSQIINPVSGTVMTKYAEEGELMTAGKALYKVADLTYLTLRAYITGAQLSQIRLNQQVNILVDSGAKDYRTYKGTITWISNKAEFTPKSIQTKEERANLVYAVKIKVKNDGYLKVGMYAEVQFENTK
jgi:HlyD family secretion protein